MEVNAQKITQKDLNDQFFMTILTASFIKALISAIIFTVISNFAWTPPPSGFTVSGWAFFLFSISLGLFAYTSSSAVKKSSDSIDKLIGEQNELFKELLDLAHEVKMVNGNYEMSLSKRSDIVYSIEELNRKIKPFYDREAELEAREKKANVEIIRSKGKKDRFSKIRLREAQESIEKIQREREAMKKELEELHSDRVSKEDSLIEAKERVEELREELQNYKSKYYKKEKEFKSNKRNIDLEVQKTKVKIMKSGILP